MVRRWGEFKYRDRSGPLHWFRTNPLFAAAALIVLVFAAVTAWLLVRDLSSPRKYVIVETWATDRAAIALGSPQVEVRIVRVTYQPGFDIRVGPTLRAQDGPALFLDGEIASKHEAGLIAFTESGWARPEITLTSAVNRQLRVQVRAIHICPPGSPAAGVTVGPGETVRFNLWVPLDEGIDAQWLLNSFRGGQLPAIDFGPLHEGDCVQAQPVSAGSSMRLAPVALPAAEKRDYYPFGAPTAQEIGVNGRRYWSDWLPRSR